MNAGFQTERFSYKYAIVFTIPENPVEGRI